MIHRSLRTVAAVLCAAMLALPALAQDPAPQPSSTTHAKHKASGSSSSKKGTAHKKSGTTHKKSGDKKSTHTPTTKPK